MRVLVADKFEQSGLDGLAALGAKGIIITDIRTCRI